MQIFALANICRNRINYKLEITGLMGFHAIAVDRAIGFLSDRHHRTVSAWQNPPLLFHLSNIFFIQHFNFPPLAFFFLSHLSRAYAHTCALLFPGEEIPTPGCPQHSGAAPTGTALGQLQHYLLDQSMFKCGSAAWGKALNVGAAQRAPGQRKIKFRINEKPSQLMLFASMIPSKRAFLQLNILKRKMVPV